MLPALLGEEQRLHIFKRLLVLVSLRHARNVRRKSAVQPTNFNDP